MTITINETNYTLKMSIKRVQIVEKRAGKPIALMLLGNDGVMALSDIETIYSWCLLPEGSDVYVAPKDGAALFSEDIEARGYTAVVRDVLTAAKECLPFLFKMS